jgi:Flp pilus assembly protein TadD/4-amino-4-deoxy-L-arabinose transferase-like glycosyltransferase
MKDHDVQKFPWRSVTTVVCVAAAVKILIALQLADHPMVQPEVGLDTTAYADLARRVLGGDLWLGPGLYFVSPLYVYVLAAGLALTDSFTAVRILQALAGACAVGGLWVVTREWANTRAAWWAAGLAITTGLITFYEVLILQASLDFALTTAVLLGLTYTLKRSGAGWPLLTGVSLGLLSLNRPNAFLAAAGLLAVLALQRRWRTVVWITAGVVLALAPITARNVAVADTWTPTSSHGGLNFYIGNSATAHGFYQRVPGIAPDISGQVRDVRRVAEAATGRGLTDAEVSDYFVDLGLDWITSHPGDAAALFVKKLAFVFHGHHIALPYSYPFYAYDAGTALGLLAVGPWLLVPLGLVGLVVLVRQVPSRMQALTWVAFVPLYAMSVAVFFVAERYRLPLLVPLCVGAGITLDAAAVLVARRDWRTLAAPALATILLLIVVNWPTKLDDGRWDEGLKLAQRFVILERHDEARSWVDRLESNAPKPGTAAAGVAMQYFLRGDHARALPYFEQAQRLDPGNPTIRYSMAEALLETGDPQRAVALLSNLTPAPDADVETWLRIGRLAATAQAPDVAERFFREAVSRQPGLAAARLQYGLNLLVQNRLPEAERELLEATRLDPRDADAWAHLAYCQFGQGRRDEARRSAEAALMIDAGNTMARAIYERTQ